LFTATGVYSDGSTSALPSVSWHSSKPQFANIRSTGILHAKKAGTLTLSATSSGVTGSTTVTVGTGTLVSVAITPANSSVTAGSTQQLTATGTFSDGTTQDVTINSHWSSTVPTVATIAMPQYALVSRPPSPPAPQPSASTTAASPLLPICRQTEPQGARR